MNSPARRGDTRARIAARLGVDAPLRPRGRARSHPHARRRPVRARRRLRGRVQAERALHDRARRLRPPGHDLQLPGRHLLAPSRGDGRRRPVLLLEGPRRARPLRGADRARAARLRADPPAAPPGRPARSPRCRGDTRGRDQHRLARDGHLEGPWVRARRPRARPQRSRLRPHRRRRAPGGPVLGVAPADREPGPARDHRDRRPEPRPVGHVGRPGQRPRRPGGEIQGVRLGGRALRRPRPAHVLADAEGAAVRGAAEDRDRAHAQGRRRLVHGAGGEPAADGDRALRLPLRRPELRRVRAGHGRDRGAPERAAARHGGRPGRARRGGAAGASLGAEGAPDARQGRRLRAGDRRAGGEGAAARRPRCRPAARLRPRHLPRALPGALLRVRDRRAGHGLPGRRDGARRAVAGRPLVRLLPVDAAERADLQQRDRGHEDHLRGLAGRARTGRSRPLAPVRPRHLRARRRPGHVADRAVHGGRARGGARLGGAPRARVGLPAPRERSVGARFRPAGGRRGRPRARHGAPPGRGRALRRRGAGDGRGRLARSRPARGGRDRSGPRRAPLAARRRRRLARRGRRRRADRHARQPLRHRRPGGRGAGGARRGGPRGGLARAEDRRHRGAEERRQRRDPARPRPRRRRDPPAGPGTAAGSIPRS